MTLGLCPSFRNFEKFKMADLGGSFISKIDILSYTAEIACRMMFILGMVIQYHPGVMPNFENF